MKVPTYRGCVVGLSINALTFWRHFPGTLGKTILAVLDIIDAVVGALFYIVSLLLVIAAPALMLIAPLTGWMKYRREMRRYEARYAKDREGMNV